MTTNPLEVPEILENILQYADVKTLVAAAQVNSRWANEATNVRKAWSSIPLIRCSGTDI